MFERFTEESINVIVLAQKESRRMGWNHVGTEQLFLGLVAEGTGLAAQVLTSLGVTLASAQTAVDKIAGHSSQAIADEIPFTPRAKRSLELAFKTMTNLKHKRIDTEHLLLGLIQSGEGVAARALENLGVDLGELRDAVTKMIAQHRNYELSEKSASEPTDNVIPFPSPAPPAATTTEADELPFPVGDASGNLTKAMQEEARRVGHNFIGTEQILLGIIAANSNIGSRILEEFGVSLSNARSEVESIIGRGSGSSAVEIPFTPRSKRVLELAWQEARQLGQKRVAAEHVLLGLIRERDGVAIRVLENLGVDLKKLEKRIRESLST